SSARNWNVPLSAPLARAIRASSAALAPRKLASETPSTFHVKPHALCPATDAVYVRMPLQAGLAEGVIVTTNGATSTAAVAVRVQPFLSVTVSVKVVTGLWVAVTVKSRHAVPDASPNVLWVWELPSL